MKILFAYTRKKISSEFILRFAELTSFLGNTEIVLSKEEFWDSTVKYDYIVINWPEYLFGWNVNLTDDNLEQLINRISYYKAKNTKIVSVLHDEYSHFGREVNLNKIFDICYGNSDILIHLGEYSKKKYQGIYKNAEHFIIYHPLFTSFNFSLEKDIVRKKINIQKNEFFIIAPGSIRGKNEFDLVIKMFKKINIKGKKLFFPRLDFLTKPQSFRTLMDIKSLIYYYIFFTYYRFFLNVYWKQGFLSSEKYSEYFTASDLVIIPRKDILNSGNVILGSQFNKLIVGFEISNIKEVLKSLNQIVIPICYDDLDLTEIIKSKYKSKFNYSEYIKKKFSDDIIINQLSKIFK